MYKFAITRPVSTLMFALAVMFFGFLAVVKLPVSLFPNIDFPIVTVITTYQGASAQTVETKVTDKIEEAVMGIDGLKKVTSSSVRNTSIVLIEFQLEKDLDVAVADVRDKIGTVRLESGIDSPSVRKVDTGSAPVISLFLTSTKVPPSEMMNHADNVIKPMLQKISGVGGVELRGYRKRQIRIYPDPTLMNKYGLTFSTIGKLIGQENVEIDGGRLVSTKYEWALTTDANSYNIEEMGELRIADGVRLKDIAKIEDSIEEDRTYASYDKTPGVIFEVQKISGQNDIKIADAVKKVFPEILAVSQDYEVEVFKDTTEYIKDSVKDVKFDLVLGAILAVVIVFLFLRSVSITIVAALSLPVSIIGTFALMSYFDLTLNMLTLLALTLAIGIIIDDAIVVIENIHKKLEAGLSKREAAYEGVREIGFAIIAISAMLLSVFIPVGTMSGIVGRFFQSFGITVALAIGLSYIVVITVIPMLSSIVVNPQHSRFYHRSEPFFRMLDEKYVSTLRFVLSHKLITLLAVLGVFIGSLFLASRLGFDFMKKEDKGEYNTFLEVAPGISMEEMKRRAGALQDIILADPTTKFATLQIGYNSQKNIFKAQIYTKMIDRKERTKDQGQFIIMDKMRKVLAEQPAAKDMTISIVEVSDIGGGGDNSPFQIAILAPNDELLEESQKNLYKLFEEKLAGKVVGVHLNKADDQPEYRFHIVRANANKYGVSSEEIGNTIRAAFSGEYPVGYYKERGKEYDITVRVPDNDRRVLDDIKRLQVRNSKGELMFLEGLVKIEKTMTPSTITRFNRQRSMTVYASPNKNAGVSLGDIFKVVLDPNNKWLADGASYKLQGEAENMQETIQAFVVAILTAIVLIYLILAALYESFLQPLIIMITLPLSFSGAFIALFIMHETFSMFSMLGLMLLMGMVGKNATLLIDVANEKRKEGMDIIQALITAGELRLRPILMTTIAMVFGMLPLAIASGAGEAMKNPIGIAMIGGLIVSMLLSLLVVPVFYRFLAPLDDKLQKLYKPKEGDRF